AGSAIRYSCRNEITRKSLSAENFPYRRLASSPPVKHRGVTIAGEDTLRPMQLDEPEIEISKKHATLILINVCVGQFIVELDQRALLVALPTLTQTFNTSLTTIQWVLLIYDLLLIGTVITLGRLGDLFGRRRFYAGGFLVFVLSSALCGIAQSALQIIIFRG